MNRVLEVLKSWMSEQTHNVVTIYLVNLYGAAVFAVLLWPQETRLNMAKDVGTALMGVFTASGVVHGAKAIMGTKEQEDK